MALNKGEIYGSDAIPDTTLEGVADVHENIRLAELGHQTDARERVAEEVGERAIADIGDTLADVLENEIENFDLPDRYDGLNMQEKFMRLRFEDPALFKQLLIQASEKAEGALVGSGRYTDETLGALLGRKMKAAGENISGIAEDVQNFDTKQMLMVGLMGGGTYLLGGDKKWAMMFGGIGLAINSSHASKALQTILPAAARTLALPIKMGSDFSIRGADFLDRGLMSGDLNRLQWEAEGLGNDFMANLRWAIDGQSANGYPMLDDFLTHGQELAPGPLKPLLANLNVIRSGKIEDLNLTTREQLLAAGRFLKQTEHLVSQTRYIELEKRRLGLEEGGTLSTKEKQEYYLIKFHMIVSGSFLYNEGLLMEQPVVQEGYNSAQPPLKNLSLEEAMPATAELKAFSAGLTDEQRRAIIAQPNSASVLGGKFFDKSGTGTRLFVYAYLFTTLASNFILPMYRKGWTSLSGKDKEAKRAAKMKPAAERELSSRGYKRIAKVLDNDKAEMKNLITALHKSGVIHKSHGLTAGLDAKLSALNPASVQALKDAVTGKQNMAEVRSKFYELVEKSGNNLPAIANMRHFYDFHNKIDQLSKFRRFAAAGGKLEFSLGNDSFEMKKKNTKMGQRINDILEGINPRNWYRKLASGMSFKALQNGKEVNIKLRHNASDNKFYYSVGGQSENLLADLSQFKVSGAA